MSGAQRLSTADVLKEMETLGVRRGVSTARIYHYVKSKEPTVNMAMVRRAVKEGLQLGVISTTDNGRFSINSAACCKPCKGGPGIVRRFIRAIRQKVCGSCRKKRRPCQCGPCQDFRRSYEAIKRKSRAKCR